MNTPKVSVVMGVYNGAEYLEQTLASILSQEGCDLEFVVVDDGSADDTGRILDEWAARDERLRVVHQQNTGLTRALIRGCAEASGKFIARQDAGDVSLPGRLAAQIQLLDRTPECVAATCHTEFIGPRGEFLYNMQIEEGQLNRGLSGLDGELRGPTHHGSVMMRRATYEAAGGYCAAFYFAQDLDLWSRLIEHGRFAVVEDVLYRARLEPHSISGVQNLEQRRLSELIAELRVARRAGENTSALLANAASVRPIKNTSKARRLAQGNYFIGCCLRVREPAKANEYFMAAIKNDLFHWRAWSRYFGCLGLEGIYKMKNVSAPVRGRNVQKAGTSKEVQSIPASLKLLRRISFPRKLGILERLYGKTLSRKGICWVETSNHVLWKLDLRDATQRWIVFGDYEGSIQMQWVKHWLHQGGVVIDSGANIGQMLLYLAPLPGVAIFAFEPLPETANWLEQCIGNYPDWKAVVIKQGLSDRKENISIQIDGARSTTRMDWYVGKRLPTSTIAVAPLDEFLEYSNIAKVRLWKLDVEGHELQALQGAERHLRNHSIEAVLVEISESSDAAIEYLDNCGYTMYQIKRSRCLSPFSRVSHVHGNILALPEMNDQK